MLMRADAYREEIELRADALARRGDLGSGGPRESVELRWGTEDGGLAAILTPDEHVRGSGYKHLDTMVLQARFEARTFEWHS